MKITIHDIRSLIACLAAVIATLSATAQTYSGGEGTAEKPFLISSIADLEALNDATNNENTEGFYYLLTNDITTPFTGMIGTEGVFHGNFDGNGHCITLNIDRDESYVGLFGTTTRATIRNLQVDGSVFAQHYVGAIVGNPSNGTVIENCINFANVTGSTRVGGIAGGIVSVKQYGDTGVTIQNCANCAQVSGNDIVGGVIGYSGQQVGNTLQRLANYGHVDAPERTGNERLGGIVGNPLYDDVVVALVNFGTISNRTISGTMGNSNPESQTALIYDGQMAPTDYSFPQQEKKTRQLIGNNMSNEDSNINLSSEYWLFEEGMLPRLKMNGIELTQRAILYATPIILDDNSQIDNIGASFNVGTKYGVTWKATQENAVFDDNGQATILSSGEDILTATLGNYSRTIAVNITADLTKINNTTTESKDSQWYNINGQKINKPTSHGIYIVNGKKFVK